MSKSDIINEIHKNARVNFRRRQVILRDIDDLWQADLMDMQSVSKRNNNCKFILVVIDAFSKFVWALPILRKTKDIVSTAFKTILGKGRVPLNLQTDNGTEFYNNSFKKIMDLYKINHYSTYSTKKASIVERVIRTLKCKLYKEFSMKGNCKWNDSTLQNIVHEYNHSYHSTIKCCPSEVDETNKEKILNIFVKKANSLSVLKKKPKFKINQFVRISKSKGVFDKKFTPNWSPEIFRIFKVQNTIPYTYLLKDSKNHPILGSFYEEELQKTNHPENYLIEKIIRKSKHKLYVKWLGLPTSENCWIKKNDIL